jgi:hypothetical protein
VFGAGGVRAGGGWVVLAFGVGVINALVTSKVRLLGWTAPAFSFVSRTGWCLMCPVGCVPIRAWVGSARIDTRERDGCGGASSRGGPKRVFIWSSSGLRSCSMKGKRPLGVCINRHSVETAQVTGG